LRDQIGAIKGTDDFSTQNLRQSFDSLKVHVLNRHDTRLYKERLWVIVNHLPMKETINLVIQNLFDFRSRLLFLGLFNGRHIVHGIDLDATVLSN
jgi:hypothetical protein